MKLQKTYLDANKKISVPEELKQTTIERMKAVETETPTPARNGTAPAGEKVISLSRHRRRMAVCAAAALALTLAGSRLTAYFIDRPLSIRSELQDGQTVQQVELTGDTLFFNDTSEDLNLLPHLGASDKNLTLTPLGGKLEELSEIRGLTGSTIAGHPVYIDYTTSKTQDTYKAYFEKNKETYMLTSSSITQEEFVNALLSVLQ